MGGFTLVEVMIATAILSFGMLLIFHSFFMSLNSSNYLLDRLNASLELSNEIWQAQDSLRRSGNIQYMLNPEEKQLGQKTYSWILQPSALNSAMGLYKADAVVFWHENKNEIKLSRSAYIDHYDTK